MSKKVLLAILDGWGLAENPEVCAITKAHTPFNIASKTFFDISYNFTANLRKFIDFSFVFHWVILCLKLVFQQEG